jgi:hypothetical protein
MQDDFASPDVYPLPQPEGVIEVEASGKEQDPYSDRIAAQLRSASHRSES